MQKDYHERQRRGRYREIGQGQGHSGNGMKGQEREWKERGGKGREGGREGGEPGRDVSRVI